MKFQIEPDKQGQICRLINETKEGEVYIMVDNPVDFVASDSLHIINLTDLQRNSSSPENVQKQKVLKKDLTVVADNLEKYVQAWNNPMKAPSSLKAYVISDIEDVKQFFLDIHKIYDAEFHPDDDFKDFTDGSDNRSFTDEEAAYLNMIMTQCFQVCDDSNIEIYDVASDVQTEIWKEKGMWS